MLTSVEPTKLTTAPVVVAFSELSNAERLITVIDKNALDAVRAFQDHANTACPYAPSGMYYQVLPKENTWGFSTEKLWEQLGSQLEATFSTLLSRPCASPETRTLEEPGAEALADNLERLRTAANALFPRTRSLTSEERQGLRNFYRRAYKKI